MQLKKFMASLGILVFLCTNYNAVAYAETTTQFVDTGISPAYEIANDLISDLDIANRTAYCTSKVSGGNAVSITVTQTLQKHWGLWIWNNVEGAEWTKTQRNNSICLSTSIGNLGNGTYRVKSVFTLTDKSGKSETITVYSNEQKIG